MFDDRPSLVSFVVPFRRSCPTIAGVVGSILKQTYREFELVALLDRDDGLMESEIRKRVPHDRLLVIHTDYREHGFSRILNLGIRAANGSYIARLDDDDIADPNRLYTQVRLLDEYPSIVLVAGWADVVDPDGTLHYRIRPENDPGRTLLRRNVICHSTATFRRDSALAVGMYRPEIVGCEDYDLWLRLLSLGELRVVQQTLVTYLLNPAGMSREPLSRSVMRNLNRSRMAAQSRYGIPPIQRQIQRLVWEIPQWRANRTQRVHNRPQND